ncbi:MAG: ATPase [Luteimonas sp.]|nr:ATPase [Luteimonas sp.]
MADVKTPALQSVRWVAGLMMLCLFWCEAAMALDRDVALRDLKHTGWGPEEGAPSAITAMAQTNDGYLWLGNASGLFRFDGLRFERFDPPRDDRISSFYVYSLFALESGGLWIGFTLGGAAFLKDGRMTFYGESDGLPGGSVLDFAMDAEGTLWAITTSGLAHFSNSGWQKVGADEGPSDPQSFELMFDSAGTLWATSPSKVMFRPRGEKRFRDKLVLAQPRYSSGISESRDGVVWFYSEGGLQRLLTNSNVGKQSTSISRAMLLDRAGSLWLGSVGKVYGGLRRIAQPEILAPYAIHRTDALDTFGKRDGMTSDNVGNQSMLEDREGNVWVASDVGLDRFSPRSVRPGLPNGSIPNGNFTPLDAALISSSDGALWVGELTSAPIEFREGQARVHTEIDGVSVAASADDGALWFGNSKEIWRYASGKFDRTPLPNGTDDFDIQAMTQDRAGQLWISVARKGVYRRTNGTWTPYGGIAALPRLTAMTLATDAKGRLWFGYTEGQMAMLDGTEVHVFLNKRRLPTGNLTAIYGKRSTVWAGGEFGLAFFDGVQFQAVTLSQGRAFRNITGIVERADGSLWFNSDGGIVHLTSVQVRRVLGDPSEPVEPEVFDALDGVQGSSARLRPLPTAIEGPDDRLWFVRDVDIYSIDPARIARNPVKPPVLIRSVTADGQTYATGADLKLPPRTGSLRIDYVALSLTMAEKVRYRYKLDGVDKDWQEAHARREAFYTNLGPGRHQFHVIAANNDGVWNETGATLNFFIAPTFVQTGWFVALCMAGAGIAVWLLIRIRVGQVSARLRIRHEERMDERERIARELHDTLLQSTQGLILRFQSATRDIPEGSVARTELEQALDRADQALAEGRDRVLDLRVAADTTLDLPQAFAAVGGELAKGHAVAFSTQVEGTPRDVTWRVRDEAYRIGREALLNAFRHAGANGIEVQIIYANDKLRVRVRDDGAGIAPGIVESGSRPGHWGLQGMRERAQRIGAELDVWSRPGAGTEIELSIPAAVAYRGSASRWPAFWRAA